MSDLPLPPEAVEVAVQRFYQQPTIDDENSAHQQMDYAIHAFLDVMDVTVEHDPGQTGMEHIDPRYRLVSRWFPVEDNTSKEAVQ